MLVIKGDKMIVKIKQYNEATMALVDGDYWKCTHEDAYIEAACCNGSPDEAGRDTCGCHGNDAIVCPAFDCTGIQDYEIDDLFERLQ
jgi:hypothetical protein